MTKSNTAKIVLSSLAVLFSVSCFQGAQADPAQQQKQTHKSNPSEFQYGEVKAYESLPDIPQYTGQAIWGRGVKYPNAAGGVAINYSMSVKEDPKTVLNWYRQALATYGWKSDPNMQTERTASGSKGSNFCQIAVAAPTAKGYNADVVITYRTTVE